MMEGRWRRRGGVVVEGRREGGGREKGGGSMMQEEWLGRDGLGRDDWGRDAWWKDGWGREGEVDSFSTLTTLENDTTCHIISHHVTFSRVVMVCLVGRLLTLAMVMVPPGRRCCRPVRRMAARGWRSIDCWGRDG